MRHILFYWALMLAAISPSVFAQRMVLNMTADSWCPYTCDSKLAPLPGYLIEIATAVFKPRGYDIEFHLLPYTRGIQQTREGIFNGVVGAARGDAPDFVFPTEKAGYIVNAFFVRKSNPWRYTGIDSLKKVSIGIVDGYDYASEAFAEYVSKNKNTSKIEIAVGDDPLQNNLRKVYLGRIDTAIDDVVAVTYALRILHLSNQFKQAGVLGKPMPIYIAFSPKYKESKQYAKIMSEGIQTLRHSGELNKILGQYGLSDWDPPAKH